MENDEEESSRVKEPKFLLWDEKEMGKDSYQAFCETKGVDPKDTIFIFPGNTKDHHNDTVTLYGERPGDNLAKAADSISSTGAGSLSLPTVFNAEDKDNNTYSQEAINNLYRVTGYALAKKLTIVLPVREKSKNLKEKLNYFNGIHKNVKEKLEIDGDTTSTEYEPRFWGGATERGERERREEREERQEQEKLATEYWYVLRQCQVLINEHRRGAFEKDDPENERKKISADPQLIDGKLNVKPSFIDFYEDEKKSRREGIIGLLTEGYKEGSKRDEELNLFFKKNPDARPVPPLSAVRTTHPKPTFNELTKKNVIKFFEGAGYKVNNPAEQVLRISKAEGGTNKSFFTVEPHQIVATNPRVDKAQYETMLQAALKLFPKTEEKLIFFYPPDQKDAFMAAYNALPESARDRFELTTSEADYNKKTSPKDSKKGQEDDEDSEEEIKELKEEEEHKVEKLTPRELDEDGGEDSLDDDGKPKTPGGGGGGTFGIK